MIGTLFTSSDRIPRRKLQKLKELSEKHPSLGLSQAVEKLEELLQHPVLIAVFGEVNSGKSSFINALLGEEICKTDRDICTDRITLIKYSPEEYYKVLDEITVEVGRDLPLLKNLTLVDTPGINSIKPYHTYITKNFIPKTDIIFVVLSALNPHTESLWKWVEQIAPTHKNRVIFVLQYKDLLPPSDYEKVINLTKTYALKAGVKEPKVFLVSSKMEMEGEEESGFDELREFMRREFSGKKLKLLKHLIFVDTFVRAVEKALEKTRREIKEAEKRLKLLSEREELLKSARERLRELAQEARERLKNLKEEVKRTPELLSRADFLTNYLNLLKKDLDGGFKEVEDKLKGLCPKETPPPAEKNPVDSLREIIKTSFSEPVSERGEEQLFEKLFLPLIRKLHLSYGHLLLALLLLVSLPALLVALVPPEVLLSLLFTGAGLFFGLSWYKKYRLRREVLGKLNIVEREFLGYVRSKVVFQEQFIRRCEEKLKVEKKLLTSKLEELKLLERELDGLKAFPVD